MKNFIISLVLLSTIAVFAQQPAKKKSFQAKVSTRQATAAAACTSSHSVLLTWNASLSLGVEGYNVYKGTTPGGEVYTAPLNGSSLVPITSYVDSCVNALTTYYYTIKASCSTCSPSLSTQSNEVSAAIPANPAPAAPVQNPAVVQ